MLLIRANRKKWRNETPLYPRRTRTTHAFDIIIIIIITTKAVEVFITATEEVTLGRNFSRKVPQNRSVQLPRVHEAEKPGLTA